MFIFYKTAIEKFIFFKLPFIVLFLLNITFIIFGDILPLDTVLGYSILFVLYVLYVWCWSWLLANWLSFNYEKSKKINFLFLSNVVKKNFLHQLKLYAFALFAFVIVLVPCGILTTKLLIELATPDEMRALAIGLSGRGELVEPGLSLFLKMMAIGSVIPAFIGLIVYIRCGFGMLALTRGSSKVGLISSWKKSKGTTLLAVKLFTPFIFGTALLYFVWFLVGDPGFIFNLFMTTISTFLVLPMFLEALALYYGHLQSDDEG